MIHKLIVYLISLLSWLLLWPMALMYIFSPKRDKIRKDIEANMRYRTADLKGRTAVLYVLLLDKFYRKLFYHRVGIISYLVSWLWRGDRTFYPLCPNMGGGVFCIHPYSTILHAKSIGENFSCRQNTTIGNKSDGRPDELPIIGNNVTLGANVIIIGNIKIGDNVTIGAGSVVVKDIPANSVAVGNPAKVIKTDSS